MVRSVLDGCPDLEPVAELAFDEVADHPLRLGVEDVERERRDVTVRGALQREQADLGPVPVGHRHLVVGRDGREGLARDPHVVALGVDARRLAPPQQGVTAEGDDHSHVAAPMATKRVTMTNVMARYGMTNLT